MGAPQRLTTRRDFQAVYTHGKSCANAELVLYALRTPGPLCRFGLSISKKVGNAVTRNRIRRILREICRRTLAGAAPADVVLVVRKGAVGRDSAHMTRAMTGLLRKAKMIVEATGA